jgi:uncharacterized protein YndB with AHSA1/START domain
VVGAITPGPFTADRAYFIDRPTAMVFRALTNPVEIVTWSALEHGTDPRSPRDW